MRDFIDDSREDIIFSTIIYLGDTEKLRPLEITPLVEGWDYIMTNFQLTVDWEVIVKEEVLSNLWIWVSVLMFKVHWGWLACTKVNITEDRPVTNY